MFFAIFWRGYGLLVPLITIGVGAVIESITRAVFDNKYYQKHGWPILVAMSISGALCWRLADVLDKRQSGILGSNAVAGEVGLKKRHEFFFIPIRAWGPILFLIGLGFFLAHLLGVA